MVFDSREHRAGARDSLDPMRIAQHPLFTAKEKIELLSQLRDEISGTALGERDLGFGAAEIEAAIQDVRRGARDGAGGEPLRRGDR